jgi:phosphonoacetate hydrolase
VPTRPVVVITVDGGAPAYFTDALDRGLMPNLAAVLNTGGEFHIGTSEMPSLTNPNNISIITGVSPAIHGIPGNYCRLDDGRIMLLNSPDLLRAPSIHAAFEKAGVPTLTVTTKDKLRLLLGNGGVPSISVEKAPGNGLPEYGIDDLEGLVGEPAPGIYDPDASRYAMRLAVAIYRANPQIRLIYVSLTDRVQHGAAPGERLADDFLAGFDELLGEYVAEDFTIGITADHGMNSKHHADGTPKVVYLGDVLRQAGVPVDEIVLPITDPYTRHHGALGSFAWLYLPEQWRAAAHNVLRQVEGIEEIWDRADAVAVFEHPADRIGDIAVTGAADTALGTFEEDHDLSGLHGALRSHGGRHEQPVPLITNRPVAGPLADRYRTNTLRSRDIHDLVLNNVVDQAPDMSLRP